MHDGGVAAASATELRTRGEALLASTDWEGARDALSEALSDGEQPETLDSLARAEWWLGEVDAAIEHRERAYVAYRRSGNTSRAATTALWLAREYSEAVGNEPASNGWLARAEGLLRNAPPGAEHGWLAFTKGDRAFDPEAMRREADLAVASGRAFEDSDLEASALALLGRAMILQGDVEAGMTHLDEAMVAVTSGEVDDPIAFGNVCCLVTMAWEEFGDMSRLDRWNQVVEQFLSRYQHRPLLSFCGTCMADMALAGGDLKRAESALVSALQALEGTGHRARCVHPAARLAEILVLQGRLEEAERILEGYEGLPDAARASVALHAAKGELSIAAALLLRRLNQLESGGLLVAPLLEMLVEIQIAQGDLGVAASTAERLTALAAGSGQRRWTAAAELATGRVELAAHRPSARNLLESALEGFTRQEMPLESARARIAFAQALHESGEGQLAIREARVAAASLERLGANREADAASALVRELGGPARTGAKGIGTLSKREIEVLRLLGEGLSNAEIAARLYISTKTAGNHVSNVLSKLGLRNRSEAAAVAVRSGETTTV